MHGRRVGARLAPACTLRPTHIVSLTAIQRPTRHSYDCGANDVVCASEVNSKHVRLLRRVRCLQEHHSRDVACVRRLTNLVRQVR